MRQISTSPLFKVYPTDSRPRNYDLPDPPLTPFGLGPQCSDLRNFLQNNLALANRIDLIVVSPMVRTIQTAQESLGWLMEKGVPVILRPEWQENSDKPCDTGTAISTMEKEWPQFDWSSVDPLYPSKTGLYEFSQEGLTKRGIEARKWLRSRTEKVVVVVSHSGFLRVGVSYRHYENADFRIFDFAEGDGDDDVGGRLVEWELTENNGGGLGKSSKGVFGWETQTFPSP